MVLPAGDIEKILFSFKWAELTCIDALDGVVGVPELALGGQAPRCGKILRLLLLLLLLLVL